MGTTASRACVHVGVIRKERVVVVGASSRCGGAIIRQLSYEGTYEIVAVARNQHAKRVKALAELANVTVRQGDLNHIQTLENVFQKGDLVILVPPSIVDDNTSHVKSVLDQAEARGVQFTVILSTLTADVGTQRWSRQYADIEGYIQQSSFRAHYTIIRTAMFLDNLIFPKFAKTIQNTSKMYGACLPTTNLSLVALSDVARVMSLVISRPAKHYNKTYRITGRPCTMNDIVKAFQTALNKGVTYTHSIRHYKQLLFDDGLQSITVAGLHEYLQLADKYHKALETSDDFEHLLREKPISVEDWLVANWPYLVEH